MSIRRQLSVATDRAAASRRGVRIATAWMRQGLRRRARSAPVLVAAFCTGVVAGVLEGRTGGSAGSRASWTGRLTKAVLSAQAGIGLGN